MELAKLYEIVLLLLLISCAVSVNLTKSLLHSVIIFMSYSSIMCILWILMESPDLAITEAAVGAGISGILFLVTLKKLRQMDVTNAQEEAAPVQAGRSAQMRRRVRNILRAGANAAQFSLDSMGGMSRGTAGGRGADIGGAVRSGMDAARSSLDAMRGGEGGGGTDSGVPGGTVSGASERSDHEGGGAR
ncbi:MAG: DUF4040 domain-containing protein [Oscillibacter sp.]|nr:DUF4040 domain-containing protein [Oscillibacter sp.]